VEDGKFEEAAHKNIIETDSVTNKHHIELCASNML